jgi:aminopeptidase N
LAICKENLLPKKIFLLSIFWIAVSMLSTAEEQELLPLGSSPHRYELATLEAGQIMRTASGALVDIDMLAGQNAEANVFVVGEQHDNLQCHVFQRELISALFKKYPRLVVGFEFFQRQDNPALELFRSGKISAADLRQKTDWYQRTAGNFGYTEIVLEAVQQLRIPVIGLNVPRELVSAVSKGGIAALNEEQRALFPGVLFSDPQHEFFIKTTFGDFGVQVPLWFANVYTAQKCWDVVMAESMRQWLQAKEHKGYKGVIIAGSGHVTYGLGIPFRLSRAAQRTRIVTIVPVAVKKKESEKEENPMLKALASLVSQLQPAAIFSRGIADYVLALAPEERPRFPVIGFSGKMNAEGYYEVSAVEKEGIAERNGIREGDIILSLDGVPIKSLEALRLILAQKNWNDPLQFEIRRRIEIK